MRKIPGAPGILIVAVGFYNSGELGPENLIVAAEFYIPECLSDEKIPGAHGILIAAAGFYNSECLSDEKISRGPWDSHRRSGILQFRALG